MATDRRTVVTRVIRPGEPHRDRSVIGDTPTERLEAVWDLTLTALEFAGVGEPRLQRSVCRVQPQGDDVSIDDR